MQVVYKIRNVVNGKFYVGSSMRKDHRFRDHVRLLRKGGHHCSHLQSAWNKYGEDCFKFEVVEVVPDSQNLQAAEDVWLEKFFGTAECYNTGRRSDAPWRGGEKKNHPNFGRTKSPEETAAISATLKAFYAADPNNHPRRGKKHTPEALAKMAQKTVHRGEDHYRFGKTLSPEVKAKISATQKGVKKGPRTLTEAGRQRIKEAAALGHYSHSKGRKRAYEECAPLRKQVVEVTTNQTFDSLTAALQHYQLKMPTLRRALVTGKPLSRGPHKGLQFSYLTPPTEPSIK